MPITWRGPTQCPLAAKKNIVSTISSKMGILAGTLTFSLPENPTNQNILLDIQCHNVASIGWLFPIPLESAFPFWTYSPAEATPPFETATGFL